MRTVPLDAIPDLGDTQVIVYSRWDRSPDIVEDQVTYPIVTSMLGAPRVKDVRGFSDFGYSYVYVLFEEGTDIYWARSRTMEYLSGVLPRLPQGVRTELGPDASGVGWVFQYALVDTSGRHAPRRAPLVPGLVPALVPQVGARGSPRSRRSAASCASTRCRSIPTACARTTSRSTRSSRPSGRATATSAAASWSSRAWSTWCAAAVTPRRRGSDRQHRARALGERRAGAGARCRRGHARARYPPRRRRPRRHWRRGHRHRRDPVGRERA